MAEKIKPNSLHELMMQNQIAMKEDDLGFKTDKKYYYHTSLSTAISILNPENSKIGPQFWVSSLSQMNDLNEAERHKTNAGRVYALCFSNRNTESIPMWYLYSGINGEGARINITKNRMQELIKDIQTVYPIYNGEADYNSPLRINDDFKLEWGWVYYTDFSSKTVYNNNSYEHTIHERMDTYLAHNYFIKDIEWAYEREFRIVFLLNPNITPPKQIALPFDKTKMTKGNSGLTVTLAPEVKDTDKKKLEFQLNMPCKYIYDSKMKIKMNLLKRNRASFLNDFGSVVSDLGDEQRIHLIRTLEGNNLYAHSYNGSLY